MPLHRRIALFLVLAAASLASPAQQAGEVKGTAFVHGDASARGAVDGAQVSLPAAVTGGEVYVGRYRDAPTRALARVPVVVFLHGSSGLGLKAIGDWQRWLAERGFATFAPDSFALPDRITYTSPVDKATYERIHALRASEIVLASGAMRTAPWADPTRLVLAGTSEGATAVARYAGDLFAARIIYSWSCENNYFVDSAATAPSVGRPVLNIMSITDPYFSRANSSLGNPDAKGHCGEALAANKEAVIVLLEQAPHTLINLPAARRMTEAFLRGVLVP